MRKPPPASRYKETRPLCFTVDQQILNAIFYLKKTNKTKQKHKSLQVAECDAWSQPADFQNGFQRRNKARRIAVELVLPLPGSLLSAGAASLNLLEESSTAGCNGMFPDSCWRPMQRKEPNTIVYVDTEALRPSSHETQSHRITSVTKTTFNTFKQREK